MLFIHLIRENPCKSAVNNPSPFLASFPNGAL